MKTDKKGEGCSVQKELRERERQEGREEDDALLHFYEADV